MKKQFFSLLAAVFTTMAFLSGCAREVIPEEVLQVPEFSAIYTSYNLWYDADGDIRSENIQQGTILPFGTQIEFIDANTDRIRFRRVSDGKEFRIKYNINRNMIPVEQFIKRLFVLRDGKDLAMNVRPLILEKIRRGIVEKGMTREEVLLAFGPPPAVRTPSETVDTWLYWTDDGVTCRIVFFGNKVISIIELD
ncbi:MAG: hypothetical protein J6W81_06700 [Lentisphaeria bacterium]|nr:hypothetical protein [Lentisphaeria bacterium]